MTACSIGSFMRAFTCDIRGKNKIVGLVLLIVAVSEILVALYFIKCHQYIRKSEETENIDVHGKPLLNYTTVTETESAQNGGVAVEAEGQLRVQVSLLQTFGIDRTTFDERVYITLLENNVTSVKQLRHLDYSSRDDIAVRLGTNMDVLERIFSMMYSLKNNFHRKWYPNLLQPAECASNFSGSIVFIFNLPGHSEQRHSIRSTWGRELTAFDASYRPIFIMGTTDVIRTKDTLLEESREFDDILLANFEEDYYNLTIKSLIMVRWALKHCPSAKFIVKVDDDVQIRTKNLDAMLQRSVKLRRTIMGQVSVREAVFRNRNSKWYVPVEVYPDPEYPSFAHGPCYILTTDWLKDLHSASLTRNYVHLEDVFVTDVCARAAGNVTTINIPNFMSQNCAGTNAVAIHGVKC